MDALISLLAPVTGPLVTTTGLTEPQATALIVGAAALLVGAVIWRVVSGGADDAPDVVDVWLSSDGPTGAGEAPDPADSLPGANLDVTSGTATAGSYGTPAPPPRRIDGWHETLWAVRDVVTADTDRLSHVVGVSDTVAARKAAIAAAEQAVADAHQHVADAEAHLADTEAAIGSVDAEIAELQAEPDQRTAPPDASSTLSALAADPSRPAPPLGDDAKDRAELVERLQVKRQEAVDAKEDATRAVEQARARVADVERDVPADEGPYDHVVPIVDDADALREDMVRGDAVLDQFERYLTWLHAPDEMDSPQVGDLSLLPSLFRTMFRDASLLYTQAADQLGDLMPPLDDPGEIADQHAHAVDLLRQLLAAAHTLHAAVDEATRIGVLHPFHERLEEIREQKARSVGHVEDVLARYDFVGTLIDEGDVDALPDAAEQLRAALEPAREQLVAVASEIADEAEGLATVTDELHALRSDVIGIADQYDQLRDSIEARLAKVDDVMTVRPDDDGSPSAEPDDRLFTHAPASAPHPQTDDLDEPIQADTGDTSAGGTATPEPGVWDLDEPGEPARFDTAATSDDHPVAADVAEVGDPDDHDRPQPADADTSTDDTDADLFDGLTDQLMAGIPNDPAATEADTPDGPMPTFDFDTDPAAPDDTSEPATFDISAPEDDSGPMPTFDFSTPQDLDDTGPSETDVAGPEAPSDDGMFTFDVEPAPGTPGTFDVEPDPDAAGLPDDTPSAPAAGEPSPFSYDDSDLDDSTFTFDVGPADDPADTPARTDDAGGADTAYDDSFLFAAPEPRDVPAAPDQGDDEPDVGDPDGPTDDRPDENAGPSRRTKAPLSTFVARKPPKRR